MDASAAEIKALMLQAARGAGMPLAHAEDAARTLTAEPQLFLTLLAQPDTPFRVVGAEARGGRALWDGPTVADLAGGYGEVTWRFAPEGAAQYLQGLGVTVTQQGATLSVAPFGQTATLPPRVTLSDETFAALGRAASKIYVPATASSRDGAAAGADGD